MNEQTWKRTEVVERAGIAFTVENDYVHEATSDLFTWAHWESGGGMLHHVSGVDIYQMHWCNGPAGKMGDPVTGEDCEAVHAFWAALREVEQEAEQRRLDAEMEDLRAMDAYYSKLQATGLCPHCGTFCDGDCQAN